VQLELKTLVLAKDVKVTHSVLLSSSLHCIALLGAKPATSYICWN